MTVDDPECDHLPSIIHTGLDAPSFCAQCLTDGADWVSLRVCLTCGDVGCAVGSPRDHAAEHYAETDHPIAAEVGQRPAPRWCYPDGRFV